MKNKVGPSGKAVRFGTPALRDQLIRSQSSHLVKPEEFTTAALATMLSIMMGGIKGVLRQNSVWSGVLSKPKRLTPAISPLE
jgi:hypothetical protein